MTKTNKIVWRLKELPTPETLSKLVTDGILSKDEAREVLFSSETQEDRDVKSLESEIKFLRELVEKLSKSGIETATIIRGIQVPIYKQYPWYKPYEIWCGNNSLVTTFTGIATSGANIDNSFSNIKTF